MTVEKQRFYDLYNQVFDKDGNTQACGRELCQKLIAAANAIEPKRQGYYGDLDTGYMNIEIIQRKAKKWR